MKQKARGGGGKVKKKPISTFRSVQMYNYSHGCTHIPPQQCTRLCIWGQKELNLRPFSVGTTCVVLHLIFFLPLLCDCVAAGCARVSSTCLQTFTSSISKRLLFFFFRPHSVRTCWFTLRPSLFSSWHSFQHQTLLIIIISVIAIIRSVDPLAAETRTGLPDELSIFRLLAQ